MSVLTKNIYLLADDPKQGMIRYHGLLGDGIAGWLIGLVNQASGPIWFPKYGFSNPDINNQDTVKQLPFMQSMTPEDIVAVFGSPSPTLPVEITAILPYIGFDGDDNTGQGPVDPTPKNNEEQKKDPFSQYGPDADGWGEDADGYIEGVTQPYLEVEAVYLTAAPVCFNLALSTMAQSPSQYDGCGHSFQIAGSTMVVTANVYGIHADGTVKSTTFTWHVSGAQVVNGVTEAATTDPTITLLLDTSGAVAVDVDVVVTTEIGSGIQVETESGQQTGTVRFNVLTEQEAIMARLVCRIWQHTLPIRKFIFPGDPARRRYTPDELQQIRSTTEGIVADATEITRHLNGVITSKGVSP